MNSHEIAMQILLKYLDKELTPKLQLNAEKVCELYQKFYTAVKEAK